MYYKIFSIDDRRAHYTRAIQEAVADWTPAHTPTINGLDDKHLKGVMSEFDDIAINAEFTVGQLGIWYSVLCALEWVDYEKVPLVTFEDDAILDPRFTDRFGFLKTDIPEDCDFLSLFIPRDYKQKYYYGTVLDTEGRILAENMGLTGGAQWHTENPWIKRAYQRYGGVCMYYTPQGAERILDLVEKTGLTDQYDDYLYRHSRLGNLNGYTLHPRTPDMVWITGTEDSIVQNSPLY